MADISKIKLPNNNTYDFKDSAGRKEAYLEWGGKNFSGSYGCIDAAMINELGANRFAFLKAAGITIEYSTDGGNTWLDYESSDVAKTGLFGKGQAHYLGKHSTNGTSTLNDMLRVTIATGVARVYTVLNKIAIYMSTSGNTVQVLMEKALESTPTNYVTHLDWTGISGWSGWNILNVSGITTYGNSPAYQYGRIRFTFKQTAVTTTYSAALISRIMAFGGVGWTTPSYLATDGHLYSYDNAQNATFPAQVNGTINVNTTVGTLAVANGGTGATTAAGAANAFINSLTTGSSDPVDADYYIAQYAGGGTSTTTYHRRPHSALWNYIKGKISSILGLTVTNYGGTSAKATADASGNTITTYYAPKSTAVTNVALATNKITKTINGTTTDVVGAASTSGYGITKLNTDTNSTSTTEAATPSAVKTAYDLANTANGTANTALSGVNGTLIYDHTYSISNGVATFTAHVYQKGVEVTSNYADSCFSWSYKLANAVTGTPSVVSLGTGKTKTITISTLGYGGYVLGTFTPPA